MREFNPLVGYPEPKQPRVVGPDVRTVENRIIAAYRGEEYYDGDRNNGYGGFKYDGRWAPIARNMYDEYGLEPTSAVLQVGCEKGFLLHDFIDQYPRMKVCGTDISEYAVANSMERVNLADAIQALKEIERVSKGSSFVTLAAYRTEDEKKLFEWWTVLGATLLHEDEWVKVMEHAGYTGDYKFTTSRSLKLVMAE